ncbi:MAG: LytTR family DNA-binding domain-containing protein [Chitinophagaceae bacterium]|jgi:DNA-binding LytR/AlgR family response regulator|nr:LytTR family DNA-binding domain-containing protein [Chitinophagaceae bacterium]MCU0403555.1 LytTR family DNA-binding domain-containing protein [Chitinophagaceae bacterium]
MQEANKIQCLVVDDEPLARDVLRRYIEALPQLQLAGECANALQALSFLQEHPVDLLLLDIHMPQLKGNEMLKTLRNPPKVIFTTAHPEYALEGYELEAVDYLLKPIQFDRFIKAIHKVQAFQQPTPFTQPAHNREDKKEQYVYFRVDRKMVKVMLDDILYIESMKDYLKIFTTNGMLITRQSMMAVEAMLPGERFLRIHRSYLVHVIHIKSYTAELLEIGRGELPIGKGYRSEVLQKLA